ncbi:MAG: hypothetical protein WBC05_23145 [Sedimentisphaerales bacterium]
MPNRRIIFVSVVCSSIAVFAVQTPSPTRSLNSTTQLGNRKNLPVGAKTADGLTIRWSAVTHRKTLHNPAVLPEYRNSTAPEDLSISCEIEMSDPRLLLGIAPQPIIEKITDSQGNDVEINQQQPQSKRMYMQGEFFIKWLRGINLSLSKKEMIPDKHYPPKVELNAGLRERIGGEIGLLKGRYEALMAESIEYIDLPFRPDGNWARLTDDVEIKVVKARNVPNVYHYEIEQRPESVLTADKVQVGEPLPSRLVVGRQTILHNSSGMSAEGRGGPSIISGRGNGIGRAEGIRYVIAINPAHISIPFELRDIPVSAPAYTTPPRTLSPRRLKPRLGGKFVPNSAKTAMRYEADKVRSRTKPVPIAKEGQFFDVDWHTISYTLNLYNPAVRRLKNSLNMSISCKARILEPELVLGTCSEPIIERITDSSGRDVEIVLDDPRTDFMLYETQGYRPSPIMTPPSILMQLEGMARSALKLPLLSRHRPKLQTLLEPVRMTIRLDPRLIRQDQKEIRRIEGYFHALTADSYKHIKVPFKPDKKWVRLTSDLEIQVARAWHDGFKYRFEINERSKAKINPGRLHVYCPLPDGILVERRFTGPDMPPKRKDIASAGRSLPVSAGGRGSVGHRVDGVDCRIDTIDYRIAVGPTHYKIPLEIEHILLPEP